MRFFVALLLILAAHFSMTVNLPAPAGTARFIWPFAVDTKPTLRIFGKAEKILAQLLSVVAGAGFLAATAGLFGILVPAGWWPLLVVISALSSILLYLIYFGPYTLLPLVIDGILLWGVLVQGWSVAGLQPA